MASSQNADIAGVHEGQIRRAGRWNNGDQMTGCYLTSLPLEFMRAVADFDPEWSGSYFIARSTAKPPSRLLARVFPGLDYWKERHDAPESSPLAATVQQDKAAGAFLELLDWLREVVLQDAVFLKPLFPDHPVFRDPLFRDPEFEQYASRLRDICSQVHEDSHQTAIEKTIPSVAEKLRSISTQQVAQNALNQRQHEETVQALRNLERKLDRLANTRYTVTISPEGRHLEQRVELPRGRRVHRRRRKSPPSPCSRHPSSPLSPAVDSGEGTSPQTAPSSSRTEYLLRAEKPTGQSVSAVSPSEAPGVAVVRLEDDETPPRFRFPQSVKTVMELWRLWRHGLPPMPSIQSLEERWGARWRARADRQYFSIRRRIFDEIVRRSQARNQPEDVSAREMDLERGKISLDKFSKALKAQRGQGAG
jgi:hypothetical protein